MPAKHKWSIVSLVTATLTNETKAEMNTETRPFPNMGAIANACNPNKETFDNGQSFSDGNIVVGIDERKCAVSFNNTEGAKNQVLILDWQDMLNLYAVLTPALRAQGLLHG